jgi:hypothetical protein
MPLLNLPKRFYSKLPDCVRNRLRFLKNPRLKILHSLVRFSTRNQVAHGPFKELSLNTSDCYPPMLLGTYEQELHNVFYSWFSHEPEDLVCIGAAEGYYAVGMARRNPTLNVIAYELDPYQKKLLAEVMRQNNVSNVSVLDRCTQESLIDTLQSISSTPYIICDIEGGEVELLDPDQITALKQAVILVEIHEVLVEGCEEALRERFDGSHKITEIYGLERQTMDFPSDVRVLDRLFSDKTKVALMNEGRSSLMKWLILEPNSLCN